MLASSIPTRFQLPWAKNAAGAYIRTVPVASQIGIQNGAASYSDGFVPDNFIQIAAGGVPPFGQDMNGVLNETTTWDQWYQAGAPIPYDSTFATAVGGYPKGAMLDSAITPGAQWFSSVDSNLTNPDDPLTSSGWSRVGMPAGTPLPSFSTSLPAGFVAMNALTIGNASSNAGYASADALFLFVANWTIFNNSQCPLLNSSGTPIARGANAVADFNANNQLTLPNGKGLGLIGADTMGGAASTFLSGVPITNGNATTPGSVLGENLHQIVSGEVPIITPSGTITNGAITLTNTGAVGGSNGALSGTGTGATSALNGYAPITFSASQGTSSFTGNAIGGGLSHNTVHRSMVVYWGQKL